mgnify:CR=1 FL=1
MNKADLSLILPSKIVGPEGVLTEHQHSFDTGILDPNSLFKAIMYGDDWEKVFPGIRTTMSRWEYCILHYFSDEFNGANFTNALHNLSRNMRGFPESAMYRHTNMRYTRIGIGPGARSNLRRNARDYYAFFKKYYGQFTEEELDGSIIGRTNLEKMHRYAKALVRHGESGGSVLEKSNKKVYHSKRKSAANAMFRVLNRLNEDKRYQPPRSLWQRLTEEQRAFIDDLELILCLAGVQRNHPAFWRLALASAVIKVLYGSKFVGEENPGKITIEFAQLVLTHLKNLSKYNRMPEIKEAIEEINHAMMTSHAYFKAPLQHVYEIGGRKLILQNFRFPTWLNLCRQTQWAMVDGP